MFDDVTFDTTNDKLKWGGVFATMGVATCVCICALRCMVRKCCGKKVSRKPIVKMLYAEKPKQQYQGDVSDKPQVARWEPTYSVAVDMSTNTDWCHRERVVYPNKNKADMGTNTDGMEMTPPPYIGGAL